MPPCSFCNNPTHTLAECPTIDTFAIHRLYIENARKGPGMAHQFLKHLRLPCLKRLAKHYGGRMNRYRRDQHKLCFQMSAMCFPEIRRKKTGYDLEETRRYQELGGNLTLEEIHARNVERTIAHKRITDEYLLHIEEVGVEQLEPNIDGFLRFCQWMRCQNQTVFPYFNMEWQMLPRHRIQPPPPEQQVVAPKPALKIVLQGSDDGLTKSPSVPETEPCCICLDTATYIETNCHHSFCNCLLHHIAQYNAKCPMCRQDVHTLTYTEAEIYHSTMKLVQCIGLNITTE